MYIVQSVVVLGLVILTMVMSFTALRQVYAMIRAGQPEHLTDRWKDRALTVLKMVFGQKKTFEDKSYGTMHLWYLYGFLVLGIGHMEVVLFGLTRFVEGFGGSPFLYRNVLPAFLQHIYAFSQDFFATGVVIVVAIALFNRYTGRVTRLKPRSKDAETILWLIGCLYLTFYLFIPAETAELMAENHLPHSWLWYQPVSSALALLLVHMPPLGLGIMVNVGWWAHLLIFLFFAVYIPRSKHMHLIAAGPNCYFRHFDGVAIPPSIDFEKVEKFGVDRPTDLTWKALLDTFSCTECGRCDAVCPANLTGKPLRPKKVLHDIKINLRYNLWPQIAGKTPAEVAQVEPALPLISTAKDSGGHGEEGQVHMDEMWACTTCAACVEVCPVLIDSVPTDLIQMRQYLVMTQASDYPKELNSAFKGMENKGNPWGIGQDKREEWAQALDVPLMSDQGDREVEYLFWVGCAGATDERAKKIQQALVRVLKKSNVDFAILGCEEKCTGDPARRMGNEYLYDTLAKENVEMLKTKKFKKLFATCPHCFNQLKHEYKAYGVEFSVQHHTELLAELLKDGRIPLDDKKKIEQTITFHDPCYLGRYNDQYSAPREVLNALGAQTREMSMNQKKSFCCGAGGGRMFMEEHIGKRINHERTDQAIATGCGTIATGCPFCMTMMSDGVKDRGVDEQMHVKDVAELVAEQLSA